MRSLFLACFTILIVCRGFGTDTLTIYLYTGTSLMVDSVPVPVKYFATDSSENLSGQILRLKVNQSVVLKFHNLDSINHTIGIAGVLSNLSIVAYGQISETITIEKTGIYRLADIDVQQAYMGLSSLIAVEKDTAHHFFWNIKEFQTSFNSDIVAGNSINFSDFSPNYFLINGQSNPHINEDSLAKVRGAVGDTILLYMLNSGNSVHSLHFHGYHFIVNYSNLKPETVGWEKDTYPIMKNEMVIIQLIPDKPGEYPVHDHNLIATTANNIYPNGMFTTMVITE